MLKRTILLALAVSLTACGPSTNGEGPKTASDGAKGGDAAEGGGATATGTKVEEGSSVCVSDLLGVRYAIEDVLKEAGLKPTGDCMFADFEVSEQGEPGEFELKYRAIGDKWQTCKSAAEDRIAFVRECMDAIITSGGGGGGESKSEGEEG